jgi:hypothetical protein
MSTEAFELERGEHYRRFRNWLNLNTDIDSAAVIYALAECVQDRLDRIDLTDGQKGGIVSDLISALGDTNKQELAIMRQIKAFLIDGQKATKH